MGKSNGIIEEKSFGERFYVREEGADANEGYGCYPFKRPMNEYIRKGFVCIDKPMGPSSHEVVVWVRRMLNVSKTGHAGTLDPRVTGVLPVLIEDATKLVKVLQSSEKEYVALMHLHDDVSSEKIERVMSLFRGKIYQRPPLKSAVKKRIRTREIYEIDILEIEGRDVLFRVRCSAGTYIRKLCMDIGEVLGCGAHMQELRRIRTGVFDESMTCTLHDLLDAYVFWKEEGVEDYLRAIVKPMEFAVANMPKVVVKDSAVDALCHGADLMAKGLVYIEKNVKKSTEVAVFTLKHELVALGTALMDAEDMLSARRGAVIDISRVIMERGTYPAMWRT